MENKTAIEIAIDKCERQKDLINLLPDRTIYNFAIKEIDQIILQLTELLPKEREQMCLFFNRGNDFGHYEDFEEYYETTFKK
jgi:hypothetical protein